MLTMNPHSPARDRDDAPSPRVTPVRTRRARSLRLGAIALALATALVLSGCGKRIDTAWLREAIKDQLTGLGVHVTDVSCPKIRDVSRGDTFRCTVTTDAGAHLDVDVRQNTTSGEVSFTIGDGLLALQ